MAKATADPKFREWLRTRKGVTLATVPKDREWNATVISDVAGTITGKTRKTK